MKIRRTSVFDEWLKNPPSRKTLKRPKYWQRSFEMKKVTVSDWDPAEYIETKEDVIAYLEVALEEKDPEFLLSVIGDIARSKGMVQLARELNLDRAGLYKALSPKGNPSFTTVSKVLDNLGFNIRIEQRAFVK
jgi:probable addiction module antidote protein